MADKDDLPDLYPKRKLLFGARTPPERLRETGQRFMEAGRYDDALEFFQRADAKELTRKVARIAMETGNTPLYMRAKRVLREATSEQEWTQIARAAERAGLHSAAFLAHKQAGHEEEAERLRRLIPGAAVPEPEEPVHAADEADPDGGET